MKIVEPKEPCKDCPYADWFKVNDKLIWGCKMSICYLDEED